jgi:hypothetical protein
VTFERGVNRILIALSVLIFVPVAWIRVEQFREARIHHEWSTESGCGVPGAVLDHWCKPETRASNAQLAALNRKAAAEYAGWTVALIAALWATSYTLRWIVHWFQGPKGNPQ